MGGAHIPEMSPRSIRHLFLRCLTQYDKLMRRRAFLDNYEQHSMFKDDLSEFEDSREILESLAEEYKACESENYVKWVETRSGGGEHGGGATTREGGAGTFAEV